VASKAAALTTAESSFILPEIMWHPSHEYVVLVSKLARVALLDRGPTGYFQIQN
jgi:acid stress chaperone HdeB